MNQNPTFPEGQYVIGIAFAHSNCRKMRTYPMLKEAKALLIYRKKPNYTRQLLGVECSVPCGLEGPMPFSCTRSNNALFPYLRIESGFGVEDLKLFVLMMWIVRLIQVLSRKLFPALFYWRFGLLDSLDFDVSLALNSFN
jgi:hypothetical protein